MAFPLTILQYYGCLRPKADTQLQLSFRLDYIILFKRLLLFMKYLLDILFAINKNITGFVKAEDEDYDSIRQIMDSLEM